MPGLKFVGWPQTERDSELFGSYTLDRRLYLNADKDKVLEEGDPRAAFLLGSKGAEIPMKEAARLGIIKPEKAEPKPAEKAAPKPADKAIRNKEDKGRK